MQETQNKNALILFRNDLRINDNAVLDAILKSGKNIFAVYCFDPRHFEMTTYGFKKTEKFRAKFLIETISDLKHRLSKLNINLLTYQEKPETVIPKLLEDYSMDEIYLQKEWTSEEVEVVESIKKAIPTDVRIFEIYNQFLYHPEDIEMQILEIPKVFTNFRKHIENRSQVRQCIIAPTEKEAQLNGEITSIPTLKDLGFDDFETHHHSAFPFHGGETAALERLQDYFFKTKKLGFYKKTRNGLIGTDFSSKFSP